jgi:hypothetical protein
MEGGREGKGGKERRKVRGGRHVAVTFALVSMSVGKGLLYLVG